jgi:hypothetical protein
MTKEVLIRTEQISQQAASFLKLILILFQPLIAPKMKQDSYLTRRRIVRHGIGMIDARMAYLLHPP